MVRCLTLSISNKISWLFERTGKMLLKINGQFCYTQKVSLGSLLFNLISRDQRRIMSIKIGSNNEATESKSRLHIYQFTETVVMKGVLPSSIIALALF